MPRTARIYCPDGIFHIISRCHAQERLLEGDEERRRYLGLLGRTVERTDARVLAWCIMSNHAHLVVQAGTEPLARLTKPLNTGYAVWKNRKEGRVGKVFAGRPKTILVETETYLLQLVRYVHLNPVRAGLVERAEHSDLSSHQSYMNLVTPPSWLDTSLVMEDFPSGPVRGPKAFGAFVHEAAEEPRRPELVGEIDREEARELKKIVGQGAAFSDAILGSPEFARRAIKANEEGQVRQASFLKGLDGPPRTPGLRELCATACAVLDVEEMEFREFPKRKGPRRVRQVVTWIWVKYFGQPQSSVAKYLNTSRHLVTRWYGRAVDGLDELEPTIRRVFEAFPADEPDLAKGGPTGVHINVSMLKD